MNLTRKLLVRVMAFREKHGRCPDRILVTREQAIILRREHESMTCCAPVLRPSDGMGDIEAGTAKFMGIPIRIK